MEFSNLILRPIELKIGSDSILFLLAYVKSFKTISNIILWIEAQNATNYQIK